jgi:phosphatidylinositol dimannoside acyltransferase
MNTVDLYRLGIRWLPRLPERLIYWLCGVGAALALAVAPGVRHGIAANLGHTRPLVRGWRRLVLSRRVLAYVFRHYADLLRLPKLSQAELERRFELTGAEHLDALLAGGGGGIMAVPHCGSFSTVLAMLAGRGYPLVLVVEPIEPPELLATVSELRRSHGLEVLTLGPNAGRDVLRALRANKIVVLAGDRDLASQAIELPFFGAQTSVPSGIARMAQRGVPVVTAFTAWVPGRSAFTRIDPLLKFEKSASEAATEQIARIVLARLEQYIAAFPDSWGVLQPVWPESGAPAARAKKATL